MASIRTVEWSNVEQQVKGAVAGAVNAVQAALPSFEAAKFGKIVNIGSNLVSPARAGPLDAASPDDPTRPADARRTIRRDPGTIPS